MFYEFIMFEIKVWVVVIEVFRFCIDEVQKILDFSVMCNYFILV